MAYKYSKGATVQGDIKAADDAQRDTLIDFGEDRIDLQTSGTVRFTVENNTITTTVPIHVSGSEVEGIRVAKGGSDYRAIVFEVDGQDNANISVSNAENFVIQNEMNGKDIQFWVNPSAGSSIQAMTIKEDGKIGISQTSPSETLHVSGNVKVDGNISSSSEVQAVTGTFDEINLDRLTLTSSQTTVPPLRLIANSLQDNVGALRIDGSEPDIYLNQTASSAGFTTVTFAHNEQPMVGFGKNSAHNLYFFRETGQDGEPHTYVDTDFVFNRSSGDITMGQNLTVGGALRFEDHVMAELSIPGLDLQTDTNAFRFNCPYNMDITGLDLYLDQHTTSGSVTVTVAQGGTTMITLSITGTNTSASTTTVTSGSIDANDQVTFAITATPANAQGLRANLAFRRRL